MEKGGSRWLEGKCLHGTMGQIHMFASGKLLGSGSLSSTFPRLPLHKKHYEVPNPGYLILVAPPHQRLRYGMAGMASLSEDADGVKSFHCLGMGAAEKQH